MVGPAFGALLRHGVERALGFADAAGDDDDVRLRKRMGVAAGYMDSTEEWRRSEDVPLEIRIGLASGPVAGGVIGEQRILFDLWGDPVNEAARMESTGEPGHIQLADSTRRLLPDDGRVYEPRRVDVKGMGLMGTYIVGRAGKGGLDMRAADD